MTRHSLTTRFAETGTGSWFSLGRSHRGLTEFLQDAGERVVEVERPARPVRRNGAKSDAIDAVRAAREVLVRTDQAEPRRRGEREAVRVLLATRNGAVVARTKALNHLQALVVTAPGRLRSRLEDLTSSELTRQAARLCLRADLPIEDQATIRAMRACARRVLACGKEAAELDTELERILASQVPHRLAEPGVGPISAAAIYLAWSHPGRIRNDAAFAALAGVAPIPASSGQTTRHRLNRGGGRHPGRPPVVPTGAAAPAVTSTTIWGMAGEGVWARPLRGGREGRMVVWMVVGMGRLPGRVRGVGPCRGGHRVGRGTAAPSGGIRLVLGGLGG